MRMLAPSTGHNISGRAASPVRSSSIAPKPPTSTSSSTCSIIERNESSGFGCSKLSTSVAMRAAASGSSSSARPCRGWMRHCMPAMRSLMVLIALRAIGISAKRRRFAGVGLGMTPARTSVGAPGVNMEGRGTVLRAGSALAAASAVEDRRAGHCSLRKSDPVMRRSAPRNVSRMFMCLPPVGSGYSKFRIGVSGWSPASAVLLTFRENPASAAAVMEDHLPQALTRDLSILAFVHAWKACSTHPGYSNWESAW